MSIVICKRFQLNSCLDFLQEFDKSQSIKIQRTITKEGLGAERLAIQLVPFRPPALRCRLDQRWAVDTIFPPRVAAGRHEMDLVSRATPGKLHVCDTLAALERRCSLRQSADNPCWAILERHSLHRARYLRGRRRRCASASNRSRRGRCYSTSRNRTARDRPTARPEDRRRREVRDNPQPDHGDCRNHPQPEPLLRCVGRFGRAGRGGCCGCRGRSRTWLRRSPRRARLRVCCGLPALIPRAGAVGWPLGHGAPPQVNLPEPFGRRFYFKELWTRVHLMRFMD